MSRAEHAAGPARNSQVSPDAGAELLGRVRLCQVIEGAELEATQLGGKVSACRNDHDRESGVRSPKPPQEGQAVRGKVQIQENKVVRRGLHRFQEPGTAARGLDLEAFLLEQSRYVFAARLSLGDKDSHFAGNLPRAYRFRRSLKLT